MIPLAAVVEAPLRCERRRSVHRTSSRPCSCTWKTCRRDCFDVSRHSQRRLSLFHLKMLRRGHSLMTSLDQGEAIVRPASVLPMSYELTNVM